MVSSDGARVERQDPGWVNSIDRWLERLAPRDADRRSAIFLLALALALSAILFGLFAVAQISFAGDVAIYHEAVRTALSGTNAYSRTYSENGLPFAYPPTALLPLLFTALELNTAIVVTWLLSTLALFVSVRALMWPARTLSRPAACDARAALVSVLVLISFPVIQTLELGQINLVLIALILVDVLGLQRTRFGGTLIGLAACVKLTPAIFIVWLWLIGRRRAALTALGVVVASIAVAAVVVPESLVGYVSQGARDSLTKNAPLELTTNQSFAAMVARSGSDLAILDLAAALAALTVAIIGLTAAVRLAKAGNLPVAATLLGLVSVSVTPISWIHHFVWLPLLAVALWSHPNQIPRARTVAAVLYVVALIPPAGLVGSGSNLVALPFASAYVLIAAAVAVWLLLVTRRASTASA